NLLVRARGDQGRAGREAVEEARAGGDQVEAPRPACAEGVLDQAGGRGEHVVGCDGADKDCVEVAGVDTALHEGAAGRLNGHVTGGDFRVGDVACTNSGAAGDPFV